MSIVRATSLLKAIGIRVAYASETEAPEHRDLKKEREEYFKSQRYSGLPSIPADIGYRSGKETSGKKPTGIVSTILQHNPAVAIGMGLTVLALLGMIRKSFVGDKAGAQKMMQYRIMAQFGTVLALVAGVVLLGSSPKPTNGQES